MAADNAEVLRRATDLEDGWEGDLTWRAAPKPLISIPLVWLVLLVLRSSACWPSC